MQAAMQKRLRRRRARRRQQGVVLLIVILILTMAMGTALFAMRSTSSEQNTAGAFVEGMWARSVAEGCTMAGLMLHKNATVPQMVLDQRWGTTFQTRYALPTPVSAAVDSIDLAQHASMFTSQLFPNGVLGFVTPKNGVAPFAQPFRINRALDCRWLRISLGNGAQSGVVAPGTTQTLVRQRFALTGIGEIRLPNDPTDTTGTGTGAQRGLHTRVAMARAYIDTLQ